MRRRLTILLLAMATGACGSDASPPRVVTATLTIGADGLSEPLDFEIPETTRALGIQVAGDTQELYALGSLMVGNDAELVGIATDGSHAAAMTEQYVDEEIGQMPGNLYQTIRLGTYAHIYPYAPGLAAMAGPSSLRVATTATSGAVDVTVIMPEDDGALTLHINVIVASETLTLSAPLSFADEVQGIFDQAGITIVVDEVVSVAGTGFSRITDFSEPQEAPDSQSAMLAQLGASLVTSEALNVFIVDSLPFGVGGLSMGVPGPPADSTSYYWGVLIRYVDGDDVALGRVIAHEVAHFLALHHLENRAISGMVYPDPIDDTIPGTGNLMERGTLLTNGQIFALSRSPLLRVE